MMSKSKRPKPKLPNPKLNISFKKRGTGGSEGVPRSRAPGKPPRGRGEARNDDGDNITHRTAAAHTSPASPRASARAAVKITNRTALNFPESSSISKTLSESAEHSAHTPFAEDEDDCDDDSIMGMSTENELIEGVEHGGARGGTIRTWEGAEGDAGSAVSDDDYYKQDYFMLGGKHQVGDPVDFEVASTSADRILVGGAGAVGDRLSPSEIHAPKKPDTPMGGSRAVRVDAGNSMDLASTAASRSDRDGLGRRGGGDIFAPPRDGMFQEEEGNAQVGRKDVGKTDGAIQNAGGEAEASPPGRLKEEAHPKEEPSIPENETEAQRMWRQMRERKAAKAGGSLGRGGPLGPGHALASSGDDRFPSRASPPTTRPNGKQEEDEEAGEANDFATLLRKASGRHAPKQKGSAPKRGGGGGSGGGFAAALQRASTNLRHSDPQGTPSPGDDKPDSLSNANPDVPPPPLNAKPDVVDAPGREAKPQSTSTSTDVCRVGPQPAPQTNGNTSSSKTNSDAVKPAATSHEVEPPKTSEEVLHLDAQQAPAGIDKFPSLTAKPDATEAPSSIHEAEPPGISTDQQETPSSGVTKPPPQDIIAKDLHMVPEAALAGAFTELCHWDPHQTSPRVDESPSFTSNRDVVAAENSSREADLPEVERSSRNAELPKTLSLAEGTSSEGRLEVPSPLHFPHSGGVEPPGSNLASQDAPDNSFNSPHSGDDQPSGAGFVAQENPDNGSKSDVNEIPSNFPRVVMANITQFASRSSSPTLEDNSIPDRATLDAFAPIPALSDVIPSRSQSDAFPGSSSHRENVAKIIKENQKLRMRRKELLALLGTTAQQFSTYEKVCADKINRLEEKNRQLQQQSPMRNRDGVVELAAATSAPSLSEEIINKITGNKFGGDSSNDNGGGNDDGSGEDNTKNPYGNKKYESEIVRRLSSGVLMQEKQLRAKDELITQLKLRCEVLKKSLVDKDSEFAEERQIWEEERRKLLDKIGSGSPVKSNHGELLTKKMKITRLKKELETALGDITMLTSALERNNETLDATVLELHKLKQWKAKYGEAAASLVGPPESALTTDAEKLRIELKEKDEETAQLQKDLESSLNEIEELRADVNTAAAAHGYDYFTETVEDLKREVKTAKAEAERAKERTADLETKLGSGMGKSGELRSTVSSSPASRNKSGSTAESGAISDDGRNTTSASLHGKGGKRLFGRLPFGAPRQSPELADEAGGADYPTMIRQRDLKIKSLEAMIHSNSKIIEKLKGDVERMDTEKEEAEYVSSQRIEKLEKENKAFVTQVSGFERAFMALNEQRSGRGDDVVAPTLKPSLDDVEEILDENMFMWDDDEEGLTGNKEEVDGLISKNLALQRMVTELQSSSSFQEDQIETLRADLVNLRVKSQQEKARALEQLMEENKIVKAQRSALEDQLVEINKSAGALRESLHSSTPPDVIPGDNGGGGGSDPALVSQVVMLEKANKVLESSVDSLRSDMQEKLAPLLTQIALLEEEKRMIEEEMNTKLSCRELTISNLENTLQQLQMQRLTKRKGAKTPVATPDRAERGG